MQATAQPRSVNNLVLVVLGVLAAALVTAVLAGVRLPMVGSERAAFWILVVVGMTMCALGMKIDTYGWLNPFNVLGIVIGSLTTLFTLAIFLGIKRPAIPNDRAAIIALAAMMVVKVILAGIRALAYSSPKTLA
jgi:hypothetical protein